jgi:ribosomal protein S18 acetylase RimI-like enzyme
MWRLAAPSDDERIVSMCIALNAEDPGPAPVQPAQVLATLAKLRDERHRGRALVCEADGHTAAYALLIAFWSNELGGEVCHIDELFVAPAYRGRGLATNLFAALTGDEQHLWPGKPVALALEVSPANERARALYERLGFRGKSLAMNLPLQITDFSRG